MGVKIINLPEFTGLPASGDYVPVSDGNTTSKLNYALLAQAIVENYEASELGGSEQSVKSVIDTMAGLLTQAQSDITALQTALSTPESTTATFASGFTNYSTGTDPSFYRIGKVVFMCGTAKPTASITGGNTEVSMFTIPSGYRPKQRVTVICQGSGQRTWLLTLGPNGNAFFSRCRDQDGFFTVGTSEWLPFNACYICN